MTRVPRSGCLGFRGTYPSTALELWTKLLKRGRIGYSMGSSLGIIKGILGVWMMAPLRTSCAVAGRNFIPPAARRYFR